MLKLKQLFSSRVGLYSLAILLSMAACQEEKVEPGAVNLSIEARNPDGPVPDPDPGPTTVSKTFSLATQNVAWMQYESLAYGEWISMTAHLKNVNADIVVVQEAWDAVALLAFALNISSKYPYHTDLDEANASWWEIFNARGHGIVIFSKYPISNEDHYHYSNSYTGWENWVNKGYVHAIIDLGNGRKTYVLGTHLKSGGGDGGDVKRRDQVDQLRTHLSHTHNNNYPVIIAGDFNTPYTENNAGVPNSEANYLVNTLNAEPSFDLANAPHSTSNGSRTKLIDYILIRKAGHVQPNSSSYSVNQAPTYFSNKAHATVISNFTFSELNKSCYQVSCPTGWSCVMGDCTPCPDGGNCEDPNDFPEYQ